MTAHVAGTTPYPWPYDGCLDVSKLALIVTGAGLWAAFVPNDEEACQRLRRLREAFGAADLPVVIVFHDAFASRVLAVERSATPLVAAGDEIGVTAGGIDGFYASALDDVLRRRGRTQLIVCGYGTETVVHSTVRSANDRGYECLTVLDASLPHMPTLVPASGSTIEMSGGIFGCVGTTTAVLDSLPLTERTNP